MTSILGLSFKTLGSFMFLFLFRFNLVSTFIYLCFFFFFFQDTVGSAYIIACHLKHSPFFLHTLSLPSSFCFFGLWWIWDTWSRAEAGICSLNRDCKLLLMSSLKRFEGGLINWLFFHVSDNKPVGGDCPQPLGRK